MVRLQGGVREWHLVTTGAMLHPGHCHHLRPGVTSTSNWRGYSLTQTLRCYCKRTQIIWHSDTGGRGSWAPEPDTAATGHCSPLTTSAGWEPNSFNEDVVKLHITATKIFNLSVLLWIFNLQVSSTFRIRIWRNSCWVLVVKETSLSNCFTTLKYTCRKTSTQNNRNYCFEIFFA